MSEHTEIDFVMPWVDGGDKEWQRSRDRYMTGEDGDKSEERFRDWDNLRYWFRGVEKYAPWVRKVHFITCGHLPEWLNTNHPKLHIVKHEDYIPNEFLPTFNSHTIELNMHRIDGLSENFVYFNDDMFLLKEIYPEDFFRDGKPCDMLAFQPVVANPKNPVMSHIYLNNMLVMSKYFKKRENVKRQPGSYFKPGYPPLYFFYNMLELAFPLYTGLYTVHGAAPFCKQTFVELWEKEGELLRATSSHRFRNEGDVNQYLFREWQKLSGNFHPVNITRNFAYYNAKSDNSKLVNRILKHPVKVLCINDASEPIDFEAAKCQVNGALERILPDKCAYEK